MRSTVSIQRVVGSTARWRVPLKRMIRAQRRHYVPSHGRFGMGLNVVCEKVLYSVRDGLAFKGGWDAYTREIRELGTRRERLTNYYKRRRRSHRSGASLEGGEQYVVVIRSRGVYFGPP